MEHLLIALLIDLPMWLDRMWRRKVEKDIPDYELLVDDPAGYFARYETARFTPGHSWAVCVMLGLVVATFGFCVGAMGGSELDPNRRLPLAVRVAVVFGPPVIGYWLGYTLCRFIFRGGEAVLGEAGVTFRYRGREVDCPWAVFADDGPADVSNPARAVVPVRADALASVVATDRGRPIEWAELAGKPVSFGAVEQPRGTVVALIRDVYACHVAAVADTIHRVAVRMVR